MELFHLASLLLDDLPCMDNADTRRGETCVHVAYGESNAILAALALINRGYLNLWRSFEGSPRDAREEASRLAEDCLGVEGILNGQAMDLNFADYAATERNVARVAEEKTGSLFRLCLMLPAISLAVPLMFSVSLPMVGSSVCLRLRGSATLRQG